MGFRIQWRRKRGTTKWYAYPFIADRPIRSLKDKIHALTGRLSQQPPRTALVRLNDQCSAGRPTSGAQLAKHPMSSLENLVWRKVVIRWLPKLHRWNWHDVRRHQRDRQA